MYAAAAAGEARKLEKRAQRVPTKPQTTRNTTSAPMT